MRSDIGIMSICCIASATRSADERTEQKAFMDVLSQFRPGQYASAGIIYIDINGMKEINDFYGHHQGDKIL